MFFYFFKQKPSYDMRISDWSSDVCSSDLAAANAHCVNHGHAACRDVVAVAHAPSVMPGDRQAQVCPALLDEYEQSFSFLIHGLGRTAEATMQMHDNAMIPTGATDAFVKHSLCRNFVLLRSRPKVHTRSEEHT